MEFKNKKYLPKSCQKIAEFSDKQQYDEANFWNRLKIQMHIIYCKHCYHYHQKNEKLTELLNTHRIEVLSKSEKEEMKSKLFL